MTEEVYNYLNSLSDQRLLTKQAIKWAEQDLAFSSNQLTNTHQNQRSNELQISREIADLKSIVLSLSVEIQRLSNQGFVMNHQYPVNTEIDKPMERLSNDICYNVIDDEDSEYGY
ncbi:hypothetical protein BHU72_14610 [Desulfuribacillus stibiiarsenatis]|uniref:Uncharacterized protein n=2 Tax=Desulfuribacillus stibiiarsenatis TaxID=1390249 RepID=A0A1E5L7N2_9FIRM|nr:hypothetical protein BHU72_14610 [Desulfuribacillus stibiiarsenatis]